MRVYFLINWSFDKLLSCILTSLVTTWPFKIARTKQTALLVEAELVNQRKRTERAAEVAQRATAQNTVRILKTKRVVVAREPVVTRSRSKKIEDLSWDSLDAGVPLAPIGIADPPSQVYKRIRGLKYSCHIATSGKFCFLQASGISTRWARGVLNPVSVVCLR